MIGKQHRTAGDSADSDDTFAYIAGYTSGGAAFGVTWEEMEELDRRTKADARIDQELGGTGFEPGFEGIFDEGSLEDRPDR